MPRRNKAGRSGLPRLSGCGRLQRRIPPIARETSFINHIETPFCHSAARSRWGNKYVLLHDDGGRPRTAGPVVTARRAVMPPACFSARLAGLGVAVVLSVAVGTMPARAGAVDPLSVDFFVDVADDDLAEAAAGDGTSSTGEILIAGIPLRIDTRDEAAAGGWRMVAGGHGRYALPITDQLAMTSRVSFTRTDFVDEVAGKAVASAATDFRYTGGGWVFGLQPSLNVTRWDTEIVERYTGIEARVSRKLTEHLTLASTGRYRWRGVAGGTAPDLGIAFGRLGLACRLPRNIRLDMAYVVRQEIAESALRGGEPSVTRGTGPSLALVLPGVGLPLGGRVDVSVNYDYTVTARHDGAAASGHSRDLHRLGVGAKWDIGGPALDMDLTASYRLEHGGTAPAQRGEARHAGNVSVALSF